jgi:hypothetical protein
MDEERPKGRRLGLDEAAVSDDPALPAFLARPAGAPAYHGFPLLEEVELDGWHLGLITASLGTRDDAGDAYIVAPDGRRAGLVWRVESPSGFHLLRAPETGRFGVFDVAASVGPTSLDNARSFLAEILPLVRDAWSRVSADTPASRDAD